MSDVLLSVKGLQVHFPIRRGLVFDRTVGHVRAVDGVDLEVERGQTYGLVGESGCGKSTLGRAILRLEEPTGGTVTFDGQDLGTLKAEELRRYRRRMQMVFQDPLASLNPRQSVERLLTEPLSVHGLSEADREEFGADSDQAAIWPRSPRCSRSWACRGPRWPSIRTSSPAASGNGSASPGR